jgi:hypothetical protein
VSKTGFAISLRLQEVTEKQNGASAYRKPGSSVGGMIGFGNSPGGISADVLLKEELDRKSGLPARRLPPALNTTAETTRL